MFPKYGKKPCVENLKFKLLFHLYLGVYSKSPDDAVFKHLAQTYSNNHLTMHSSRPRCGDRFTGGITNGAHWYDVPGKLIFIKKDMYLLLNPLVVSWPTCKVSWLNLLATFDSFVHVHACNNELKDFRL